VGRWEPNARGRLERAALELFVEQGFADTTVPQITARAGLTTRTFFRHFADKREVLFGYETELPDRVARLMADSPASHGPMDVIGNGLQTVATTQFTGQLEYLRTRRAVIVADEGLRERELRKQAILSEAISLGFVNRGPDELTSTLAAHTAVTAFSVAVERWLDQDTEQTLSEHLRETLNALRAVTSV